MAKQRKTPQTWINAGLKALPRHGVDGIRAETLARALDTTKGSFYWHFKDVPAYHKALLAHWIEGATARFIAALDKEEAANQRLRALSSFRPTPVDQAIRAWANHDKQARKAVAELDAAMLSAISACLGELNATHPDFPGLILASILHAPKDSNQTETLVDLLLMLK